MNKKGFTLIELLAVIVVLAIVMVIAVSAVGGITNSIQENMLNKKLNIIEEAAVIYGQDRKGPITTSKSKYNGAPCTSIIISDLVPDYLDKDNENNCLGKDSTETIGCIEDPSDTTKFLDKYEVILYYKNKRIKAVVDKDNNLVCS